MVAKPIHPAAPERPAPPVRHVEPAAAHHTAVPVALSKPHVKKVRTAVAPQKRFVVQAAAQVPAAARVAVAPQTLDTAVKAVDNAHKAVKDAEKVLHKAKEQLSKSKKDLEKLRDAMKPSSGKKPCDDDPAAHHQIKKTDFPAELAKRIAQHRTEGKHVKKTTSESGGVVTKTATSSGNGVYSSSTATSTNGTVSADAW